MDDQYYYLLDGEEHGPFSRAAVENLLATGKLNGSSLRVAADTTWRSAEELGFHSELNQSVQGQRTLIKTQPELVDASRLEFRSPANKPNKKNLNVTRAGTIFFALMILGGVGYALHRTRVENKSSATTDQATHSIFNVENGSFFLEDGQRMQNLPDGNYQFSVSLPEDGGQPTIAFLILVKGDHAKVLIKNYHSDDHSDTYLPSPKWEEMTTVSSNTPVGWLTKVDNEFGHIPAECVAWQAILPVSQKDIDSLSLIGGEQIVAQAPAVKDRPDISYKSELESVALCTSEDGGQSPMTIMVPKFLMLAEDQHPELKWNAKKESTGEFSVKKNQIRGMVLQQSLFEEATWLGKIDSIESLFEPTVKNNSEDKPVNSAPADAVAPPRSNATAPDNNSPAAAMRVATGVMSVRGSYQCFLSDSDLPSCSFTPNRDGLLAIGKGLAFDVEEFDTILFRNQSDVRRMLAPQGSWSSGSCFVGGDAEIQVRDLRSEQGDGGIAVTATLLSYSYRTGPDVLPTEQQPEGCDPAISGL